MVKAVFLAEISGVPLGGLYGEARLSKDGVLLNPPEVLLRSFGPPEARWIQEGSVLIPYNAIIDVDSFKPLKIGIKYVKIRFVDRLGTVRKISFAPITGTLIPTSLAEQWVKELRRRMGAVQQPITPQQTVAPGWELVSPTQERAAFAKPPEVREEPSRPAEAPAPKPVERPQEAPKEAQVPLASVRIEVACGHCGKIFQVPVPKAILEGSQLYATTMACPHCGKKNTITKIKTPDGEYMWQAAPAM